jgi:hypothetical protein
MQSLSLRTASRRLWRSYEGVWDSLASFDNDYIETHLPSPPVNLPLPSFSPGAQKDRQGAENPSESMQERILLDENAPVIGAARRHAIGLERAFERDIYNMVSVRALRNPKESGQPVRRRTRAGGSRYGGDSARCEFAHV